MNQPLKNPIHITDSKSKNLKPENKLQTNAGITEVCHCFTDSNKTHQMQNCDDHPSNGHTHAI